jgi:hypothetical protein
MNQQERELAEQSRQKASRFIWVTFCKEGLHYYPGADMDPGLATKDQFDVGFLGWTHRHLFHFKVSIQVWHDDREIEFIQFKRWLESLYADNTLKLNNQSCEMIADSLYLQITSKYPNRDVIIEVSEDGENGSITQYPAVIINPQ